MQKIVLYWWHCLTKNAVMKITETDFFNPLNAVTGISDTDYKRMSDTIDNVLNSMTQISDWGFYIIDYFKQNFLYVSDNIAYWCGIPAENVKDLGYKLYTDYVQQEDLAMLKEINDSGFKQFERFPEEDRCKYSITYDFHFVNSCKTRLIHHRLTPLALKNGKIWLALCGIALSFNQTPGHIILRKHKDLKYLEYSLTKHQWIQKINPLLSDIEKEIIKLSAKGFLVKEIADILCKSEDTIKTYRKNMIKALGLPNFTAVITHAINYGLI